MPARRVPILLAVLAASLLPAASAWALGPGDFAVEIADGPSSMQPPADFDPTANCDPPLPQPGGATPPPPLSRCTASYAWSDSATVMSGAVRVVSTGATGTIALRCDWNLRNTVVTRIDFSNPTIPTSSIEGFSGSGGEACSWVIRLGGSSLIGTLTGTTALTQPTPTTGRFTGELSIVVVGGTGDYAAASGTGAMTQVQDFPLAPPASAGGLRSGGSVPIAALVRRSALLHAVATRADSSMRMTLQRGRPKARFLVPRGRITRATKWRVHLAAAPKTTCRVRARKGDARVGLGTLRDPRGTGTLVGTSFIGTKLRQKGTWTLAASCTKRVGGRTVVVPVRTAKLVLAS